ncbi:irregular chiasm C-roughest protein-like [Macrosteles quadrilineatus]|uniref:irregular chiasm C-roughest protein-like n=1 Tax=Macrosteles quadrilineatus TaxID=74068 RepID=UPI0023E14395|nr:irregular chiasm C-roughest protein-like [Macrosteles quadrilineatus]
MSQQWVLVVLVLVWQTSGEQQQKFAMEPQDQTAVVGSRVTLPCRVINKSGLLQWTKDGFGLGNLTGFERYSMVANEEEGDYSLQIFPVLLEDDAVYVCQVAPGPSGDPPLSSTAANLTVLVSPEPPVIIQGSQLLTTEGRDIRVECISIAGKPPAEITWIDGLGNVLQEGTEQFHEPLTDQPKLVTVRSVLKMRPTKDHHNTTITCQAQNMADRTYRSARLRLEVKYAPKVNLVMVGQGSKLAEGQDVRLLCSVSANPPEVSYRWFINDQLVLGDPASELVLQKISQKDHNSLIKCEVSNMVGRSEQSERLDVSYGPRFRVKPYSVQADVGATVTLTCDVDGNPKPNIVWIHEDSGRVVSTSSNLTITVTHESAGRYFCRATVPGFPDIKADATIYMKGPPTIISHRTQYGIPGDTVRLECSAFSIPTPQKVVWNFKGEDVASDLNYSVLEDQLTEGIKSTLIIQESRLEHFGVYNCTVSNPYGSDVVEITLKAQKSFPLNSTVFGIIVVVLLIITVSMLLLLCQRKEKKIHIDKTDHLKHQKESDRSSNISDLKLEIEYSGGEGEGGSETASERGGGGLGLPLAGPVPLDHRYSQRYSFADYSDQTFPPKNNNQNNGYVAYLDYSRDYSPPTPLPAGVSPVPSDNTVDPRYSAVYGNPYLRHPVSQLPPPPSRPQGPLPPPPYATMTGVLTKTINSDANRGTLATHV